MNNRIIIVACLAVVLMSCARAVTPLQAASGKYNKCRPVR
jgi:hypothetical protein